ncbi:MAG: Crp/Fnr family transcriptional regulator [Chitinophagaceae bacterium]|nr:Crp/Fnr family transcriptional regulator [Chitinophagaceae bacterium]
MNKMDELFPEFDTELLSSISDHGQVRQFSKGEALIRTGQYMKHTMLVLKGLVKVYREDEEGNEFFMYYLKPGQACALSMICAVRMEASQILAIAVEDTEVIMIPLEHMKRWMSENKSWYQFVVETYRDRFEEMLTVIDHVAFRKMDERLEHYLHRHVETTGNHLIGLSHQEIADELNSSREVISRLLKKMEQLGKVKLHRNQIEYLHSL